MRSHRTGVTPPAGASAGTAAGSTSGHGLNIDASNTAPVASAARRGHAALAGSVLSGELTIQGEHYSICLDRVRTEADMRGHYTASLYWQGELVTATTTRDMDPAFPFGALAGDALDHWFGLQEPDV